VAQVVRPVVAIVQARTGSSRFPRKVLAPVLGKPMLLRQLERVNRARTVDQIVVATTADSSDDEVAELVAAADYDVFRGSENDVLDRFHQTAVAAKAGVVVRLTGDCPLTDAALIDEGVEAWRAGQPEVDFVSNALSETYPDGMDVEVFSAELLERAWREASLPSEREHVTFWFWKTGRFRVERLSSSEPLGQVRLTVDYPEDLDLVCQVYERLYLRNPEFGLADIVAVLPELHPTNERFRRYIGWESALARDRQPTERQRS
jgi:spore coat polysaccharide biosynthesis protein SpsF